MSSKCPKAPVECSALSLHISTVPGGTRLYRFHGRSTTPGATVYRPNSFNPNTGKDWTIPENGARFNPFPDAAGVNVGSLYAASSLAAAALESVFHAVPHVPNSTYDGTLLQTWQYSEFLTTHDIFYVMLTNPQLHQLKVRSRATGLLEGELIHSQGDQYPRARTWAKYLHDCVPTLNALGWRPRLGGQDEAYMLFGDRCSSSDLSVAFGPTPIDGGFGHSAICKIAEDANITII